MPSSSSAATRPCSRTSPSVARVVPVMILSSVLLPAPLKPTMPTASPGDTVKLMSRSAQLCWWRGAPKGSSHSASRDQRLG